MVQHDVKVVNIEKTTDDCAVLTFDIPNHVKDKFVYKQGQFLTLQAIIDGEEVRRSYSLCSSPLDDEWKVAVKRIQGGVFSSFANSKLQVGDVLTAMEPSGSFFVETNKTVSKNYIAFAAGSGITPILSIVKTHLLTEPKSTFKLFYLNRTAKSIILKEEIEQLKNEFFERFQVFYFLTKEQRDIPFLNGRFDSEKIQFLANTFFDANTINDVFICGPKEMIFLINDELQAAGIAATNIHYELFFSGDDEGAKARIAEVLEEKVDGTSVTIIDGGKEFHFVMDSETDNILDGALAAGADLPFACKGGVCSTCKCKIVEGEIKMKVNYALEAEEVANNFALSCQAVPITEKVVVDFDV